MFSEDELLQSRIDYMDHYMAAQNAADGSETDANANVAVKNVANLEGEIWKTMNRKIQRKIMKQKLQEMYPEVAEQYEKDLNSHIIYACDESVSSVPKIYCSAVTLYPLLMEGAGNIDGITPTPPNDIQSFFGQVTNVTFLLSSQSKGACLYKDTKMIVKKGGITYSKTIKDFVNEHLIEPNVYNNNQGNWEYCDVSGLGLYVAEDERFVKVTKVMRRKYHDLIYKITTLDGLSICTSTDHRFKQLYHGRTFETKADALKPYDSVVVSKDNSMYINTESYDWKKGWIIGMLCGDGCLTGTAGYAISLSINYDQDYLGTTFNEYFNEIYGCTLKKRNGHRCFAYEKKSKEIYNKITTEEIIGNNAYDKHIDVSNKSLDYLTGFLDGLLSADGHTDKGHCSNISIANKDLANNVVDICAKLGIKTSSRIYCDKRCGRKPLYVVNISQAVLYYTKHFGLKSTESKTYKTYKFHKDKIYHFVYHYGYNAVNTTISEDKRFKIKTWGKTNANTKYNTEVITNIETFYNDDDYVYEIETTSHWYNAQGFITHNCALGSLFVDLAYFVAKEFGNDWYNKLDEVVTTEVNNKQRTVKDVIRKGMKQFIYGVNQPAGNRSYNSPFTNVSYYDKTYFDSLFGDYYFPDGTQPEWKAVDTLQRIFMELHRDLRLQKPLTFPVSTIAMVHDGKDIIDKEYKKLCAEEWAKGGSFFAYINDNPTSLASCCFDANTPVLWKGTCAHLTTFERLFECSTGKSNKEVKIYHNGEWLPCEPIRLPETKMYRITTENNKELLATYNHIHVSLYGNKTSEELQTGDYLLLASKTYAGDGNYTYEQGYVTGLFLCCGKILNGLTFTLKGEAHSTSLALINMAERQLGGDGSCNIKEINGEYYTLNTYSSELLSLITLCVASHNDLNTIVFTQSIEFRRGILDAVLNIAGGHIQSKHLADSMEALCTTLGLPSVITTFDNVNEFPYNINGYKFPCYQLSLYNNYYEHDGEKYVKIRSISITHSEAPVYCVKLPQEPYLFTLPNGIVTHNCRVLNEMQENTFSSTIGLTGIMTGSCNVITLNLNRIIQNFFREYPYMYEGGTLGSTTRHFLGEYIGNILDRVYKYHIAYKTILYDMEDKGMFSNCNASYIMIKKLYSTIGLLGYCEAAEYLGYKVNNNEDYKEFIAWLFNIVKAQNKAHSLRDKNRPYIFNSEAVPGENMAVKFYSWDKEDGYVVPSDQNLYCSYFFKPWDKDVSVIDKMILHGKYVASVTDGGQACHINLSEHLSTRQYEKLIDIAIKEGTNYFTFNIPISECKDCGHVVNAPIDKCPKCGSEHVVWWTRIIGFLRPIDTWSKERQIEGKNRVFTRTKTVL